MIIRKATLDDVPAIAILDQRCFGADAWSQDLIRSSLVLDTTHGIVMCEGDRVAGFALLQVLQGEIEILTIGVDPDFRREGLGRQLVREILALQPMASVFLEVAADNLPAQGLYEKCGFKLFGRRPAYYLRADGPPVDALTYRHLVNDKL